MSMAPAWVRDRLSDQGRKALVESLSTPPPRVRRDTSGGKKPQLWMPLFSLLQMGASSSKATLYKYIKKKKMLGQVCSPELKKTFLIFCDTEWQQHPLEDGEC